MDNELFEIYKSLVQTPVNSINSFDLDSHIKVLSDLNLNKLKLLDTEIILSLLKNLIQRLEYSKYEYISKICLIIKNLIKNSNITANNYDEELQIILNALIKHPESIKDLLAVLDALLSHTKILLSPELTRLLLNSDGILFKLANTEYVQQIRRILSKIIDMNDQIEINFLILMKNDTPCELILHSLRNLRKNIEKCSDLKTITNAQIRKIVSIGWRYMCFEGLDAKKDAVFELHPSEFALPSHSNAFKSKPLDKKKSSIQRSFEEVMDHVELPPEGDLQWDNSRSVQSCIRHAAICVLIRIIRCTDSQIIFQYWPYLIFPGSPSLRNCIRNDCSWGVRFVALVALEELMTSAKSFLNFAEKPRTAITSFTTFSETLGATILKLHDDFLSMLYNSSIPLIQQSLRCLSVLICCTPYQRMPNCLILRILNTIQPIKDHHETSIKFEFLSVLQSVLISSTGITDINFEIVWIFEMIFGYTINSDQQITIKVESLILLSSLCKSYFEAIVDKLDSIEAILKASLTETSPDVRMQAARTVEILSNTLQESINTEGTSKLITKEDYFKFWDTVIPEVIKLIKDDQHSQLRMAGCDCLGSINENIFERLPRPTQLLAITLLFTSTKDNESRVRGAAIRAITRGILEAGREEDFGLMADITQSVLCLIEDSSLFVRTKAAWALSNLTDALLLNRDIDENPAEDMPNCMYNDLLRAAVQANKDNDKVRCNIIRALGNLLHLSTPQMLNNNGYKTIVISAINELVKNTTTGRDVKIKWNSCYAIGNMLKNEHIYSFVKEWEGLIFPCLLKSGLQCSNFKVRINASLALSSPSKREHYGLYWQPIWNGLVEVLNGAQHIEDFKEYKHRDMLIEQVCFTLAHLISVADIEDLQLICENIDPHVDFVQHHISKCYEQVLPEKAAVFSSAIINLNSLKQKSNTEKQKRIIYNVTKIFNKEIINL